MAEQSTAPAGTGSLDAAGLIGWARQCVERLRQCRDEINALNVFPVPDSDTGTNLLHTMRAALDQAEGESAWTSEGGGSASARDIAVALGHGAVHGARGNSGVILSQVLRAIGEAATFTVVDATTLKRALRTAVTLVDHALSDPVEGTIVTVLRAASTSATASSSAELAEVARAAADGAAEALDGTTSQLAVLRRAGVVDAGGRGLLVLLDTLVEVLTGERPERHEYLPVGGVPEPALVEADCDEAPVDAGPRFEVMYSLTHSEQGLADDLRAGLRGLGDSVIVVGDGGAGDAARWTVHVHTDEIGGAIDAGLGAGRMSEVRVTDLTEVDGHTDAPDHGGAPTGEPGPGSGSAGGPHPDTSATRTSRVTRTVVAVAPSGAIADLFADAGAVVVPADEGAEAVVDGVLAVESTEMIVLPNGALTRADVTRIDAGVRDLGRHVLIVPTGSVTQGLAALAVHDPSASLSVDGFSMADAAAGTRHARVIRATHDALTLVGRCRAGDLLGVVGHDVALISHDPVDAIRRLTDHLLSGGGEMVTFLLGPDAAGDRAAALVEELQRAHPDIDVVSYDAGGGDVLAHIGVE